MNLQRRSLLLGIATSTVAVKLGRAQQSDEDYIPFEFTDIYAGAKGPVTDTDPNDLVKVGTIVALTPTGDFVSVMEYLAGIPTNNQLGAAKMGSTGEYFNHRWKRIANPLIVKFFHDIGYKKTPMAGDCTPWCAATLSWALQRSGVETPNDPASSQSFLHSYGRKLDFPRELPVRGDICVFTGIDDASHGHVGVYKSLSEDQRTVRLLAANQDGAGATQCPAGYPRSQIDEISWAMNVEKDRNVSTLHFNAFVRPPA